MEKEAEDDYDNASGDDAGAGDAVDSTPVAVAAPDGPGPVRVVVGTYVGGVFGLAADIDALTKSDDDNDASASKADRDDDDDGDDDAAAAKADAELEELEAATAAAGDADADTDPAAGDAAGKDQKSSKPSAAGAVKSASTDVATASGAIPLKSIFSVDAHRGSVKALAATSNGRVLVSGGSDETIRIYDMRRQVEFGELHRHSGAINCLAFYRDDFLLSGGNDGRLCVWHAHKWNCMARLKAHKGEINSLALHPTGRVALSVGKDKMLLLWDLVNGKVKATQRLENEGRLVAWTLSGVAYVLVQDKALTIFELNGETRRIIPLQVRTVSLVFLSESVLVTGCEDGHIRIYDIDTGTELNDIRAHTTRVRGLVIAERHQTDDDSELALTYPIFISSSSDGSVKIWSAQRRSVPPAASASASSSSAAAAASSAESAAELARSLPLSVSVLSSAQSGSRPISLCAIPVYDPTFEFPTATAFAVIGSAGGAAAAGGDADAATADAENEVASGDDDDGADERRPNKKLRNQTAAAAAAGDESDARSAKKKKKKSAAAKAAAKKAKAANAGSGGAGGGAAFEVVKATEPAAIPTTAIAAKPTLVAAARHKKQMQQRKVDASGQPLQPLARPRKGQKQQKISAAAASGNRSGAAAAPPNTTTTKPGGGAKGGVSFANKKRKRN